MTVWRLAVGLLVLACAWLPCAYAQDDTAPAAEPTPARPADAPAEAPPRRVNPELTAATTHALISRHLSFDIENVPLQDVLEMLTAQAGVGLALDGRITAEALARPLSLKLRNASIYAVLHWVFRKHQLSWVIDGGEVFVAPAEFMDAALKERHARLVAEQEKRWKDTTDPQLDTTKLSLDLVRVPLERTLEVIAEEAGVNLVWENTADDRRDRRVTLEVKDATVRTLLDQLAATEQFTWSLEAEAVLIAPREK